MVSTMPPIYSKMLTMRGLRPQATYPNNKVFWGLNFFIYEHYYTYMLKTNFWSVMKWKSLKFDIVFYIINYEVDISHIC